MPSPRVSMVGIGPWRWEQLTLEAAARLAEDVPIFCPFAPSYHPVIERLANEGRITTLFALYEMEEVPHAHKYRIFAEIVVRAAKQHGHVVWAVPGNAFVYDTPSALIVQRCKEEGIEVEVLPGLSSIEAMYGELRIDPGDGLQLLDAHGFGDHTRLNTALASLLLQTLWPNAAKIAATLSRHYPPDHELTVVEGAGYGGGGKQTRCAVSQLGSTLAEMELAGVNDSLLSIYVPAVPATPAGRVAEEVYRRTRGQVVEHELLEGGLMLIPVAHFRWPGSSRT